LLYISISTSPKRKSKKYTENVYSSAAEVARVVAWLLPTPVCMDVLKRGRIRSEDLLELNLPPDHHEMALLYISWVYTEALTLSYIRQQLNNEM